jgi:alcohol dehydrogenase
MKERNMFSFQFYNPTQVTFGIGSSLKSGEIVQQFGKSAIILSGTSHAMKSGLVDDIVKLLDKAGVKSFPVSGVEKNPTLSSLVQIANQARNFNPDCIIALGGGSVMDAARILSLILTHSDDPWEYRVTGKLSVPGILDRLLPVVTIPTTAGTGSEASPAALVNHDNRKEVYFSPFMYPKATIIDPNLSLSLPANITAQIGMDAFVQSLEAYVSVNATPFSDTFAVRSMQLVYENLPDLVNDLKNELLRSHLCLAGLLSLYAISPAGVGAVHALSDPLGGRYNITHGLALSILLPSVMKANLDANIEKFASLTKVLGVSTSGMDSETAARKSINIVEDFIKKVGLAGNRLSQFGISPQDFPVFADEAENPDMSTNPKKLSKEQIINIYQQVL